MLSGAVLDTAIGVLQITIRGARGIKATKIGGGTPDPYVSLSLANRTELARTSVRTNTYNPDWSETKFVLVNNLTDPLTLAVMDYNEHRKDSEIGVSTFDLAGLKEDAVREVARVRWKEEGERKKCGGGEEGSGRKDFWWASLSS